MALLQNRGYDSILRHRNYNPRVIEFMTQARHACAVAPSLYLSEFTDSLEHPTRVWDHAFRHQISEPARHIVLVLGTLPEDVLLGDLEAAFWTFYRFRQARFGFAATSGDWNDALKQIEGSFVATRRVGDDIVASFHNPSIRDFVEDFLSNSDRDVADLISGAHFYEQYRTLWTGRHGHRYRGVDLHRDEFLREFHRKMFGPSAKIIRVVNSDGEAVAYNHWQVSNESRAEFAVRVANELKTTAADQFLAAVIDALEKLWDQGQADREDLVRLLQVLTDRGLNREDSAFITAKRCLSTKIEDLDEFRAVAEFSKKYPDGVSSNDLDHIKTRFLELASEYSTGWDGDAGWYRQIAADLEFAGERFDVDVRPFTERLYDKADEAESERAEMKSDAGNEDDWEKASAAIDSVDEMFQSLREELES